MFPIPTGTLIYVHTGLDCGEATIVGYSHGDYVVKFSADEHISVIPREWFTQFPDGEGK